MLQISTKKPFKKITSADLYTSAGGARDKKPVYFMFLDREKSLWAWVRIMKSGFDKGWVFSFHCFSTYVLIVNL